MRTLLAFLVAAMPAVGAQRPASAREAHDALGAGLGAYRGLLGVMTVAIAIQGWLGGSFMNRGLDHLAF